MPPDLPKDIFKLATELIKHQAKKQLGDGFMDVLSSRLVDYAGDNALEKVNGWLGSGENAEKLLAAFQDADKDFHDQGDDTFKQMIVSKPMGQLESLGRIAKNLPKTLDDDGLLESLRQQFETDWPNLSSDVHDKAAHAYRIHLERNLAIRCNQMLPSIFVKIERIEANTEKIIEKLEKFTPAKDVISPELPGYLKPQLFQIDSWIQPLALEEATTSGKISFSTSPTIVDALKADKKIILVGTSGSGKTLALKSTTNQLNESSKFACCWIPLKNYSKSLGHTIKDVLGWRNIQDDQVISALEQQNLTLLLDGLNEVTIKDQEDCIKEIDILLNNYQGQVCISYTISDVAYFGIQYPTYKVLPLNKGDIEKTIKDFFKAKGTSHKADWFLQSIRGWDTERQQEFDKLASLPINLQFLLELAQSDDFSYNSLGDLYGQVIQKRLERTRLNSQRNQVSTDIKTDCLMGLAYKSILKDHQLQMQKDFIRETFAELANTTKIDVDLALKEVIRAGLLFEVNDFLLEWPHSSFRDYLAGRQLFNLVENDKPFDEFPLDKSNGAKAAAHATRLLTTQSRNLRNRPVIFVSTIKRRSTYEIIKTIADEYYPAIDYYISINQEISYSKEMFVGSRWGERFVETYNLIKEALSKNNYNNIDYLPSLKGLNVYFDNDNGFCAMVFSNNPGVNFASLERFEKLITRRQRNKSDKFGFCLFAPFLLLLDPEIIAYIQIGFWLRLKIKSQNENINDWHKGLALISPHDELIYWNKQELPSSKEELLASPKETMEILTKTVGRDRLDSIITTTDILTHSKTARLNWSEINMPVAFEINSSRTSDAPRIETNRLGQIMVEKLPTHHISLIFLLSSFSAISKVDRGINIFIPFPISALNRFYYFFYENGSYSEGKNSWLIHLRG